MEPFSVVLITHAFTFFLGLVVSKVHNNSQGFLNPLLSNLSQIKSGLSDWFSFGRSRAAKANRLLDQVSVELLDRYQVEEKYDKSTWQRKAYDDFTGALVAKDKIFPCIYGTKGYKANELDFLFLESEDLNNLEIAKVGAKAIVEYHKILQSRGRNISLVLLCPPPKIERSVEEYHKIFWSFLKRLRQLDPKPWPKKIPHDTQNRQWCMNFDGLEAFFAVLTPAHKQRRSRSAPNFAMVYQPRMIFDVIFKDPRYRESATRTVRGLVDKYDEIPHSPDISDYAREGTTESRQYFLLDKNETAHCPYDDLEMAAQKDKLNMA
ncbi:YqcI/YcgG family protein [Aspergillus melleus]|uniref:YqcI/YcgG family protein n=1 Tax=Aspergillus melleus TaxID=138277 RepID=UPI001E8DFD03|nr:uncharacterized protein LDX57_005943 [Aspergillus melleus]KAH8428239.1 hypothetical protein LDX57_005943 [Aspergillus melleus]